MLVLAGDRVGVLVESLVLQQVALQIVVILYLNLSQDFFALLLYAVALVCPPIVFDIRFQLLPLYLHLGDAMALLS